MFFFLRFYLDQHIGARAMLGVLLFSVATDIAHAESEASTSDDNVVIVIGRRKETTSQRQTGRSLLVRPEDASRFDSVTHLKRESSVIAPETGHISPSGFVVPKIRGQDTKFTDVYLEDTLLQDPYSGLPLIEDMDLRAFGSLEIHQGAPPVDLPGLNPIGTLRYRFRETTKSSTTAGLQTGRPYGISIWGLGVHHAKGGDDTSDDTVDARLYLRQHQTNGHYKFYSDESTPYNSDDDRIRTRENNDQRSEQMIPFYRRRIGPYRVQALGWAYRADRGLPSPSVRVPSAAREHNRGHLGHVSLLRTISLADSQILNLGLGVTENLDQRQMNDPDQRLLIASRSSHMDVHARRLHAKASLATETLALYLHHEATQASVGNRLDDRLATQLQRRADATSLGFSLKAWPFLTFESKAALRQQFDNITGRSDTELPAQNTTIEEQNATRPNHRDARAYGSSIALAQDNMGVYAQVATAQRLPSLLEEFGNGSNIQANADLVAERMQHNEVGAFIHGQVINWRLGLALYEDKTKDKISLVPVSANTSKALNIQHTTIHGIDTRGEISNADQSRTLFFSAARLLPYDDTNSRKLLPGIPERILVAEIEQRIQKLNLRWMTRYRSSVYRDLANSVELPGAYLHDASADYCTSLSTPDDTKLGLSIRNVFNLMSTSIYAPGPDPSRGRTSYSDIAGAPLPGRQWILSIAASF